MPLSQQQKSKLSSAIENYSFPSVYYDFIHNAPCRMDNLVDLERLIRQELICNDWQRVKDGLSNVLYWGYAQMGIRDTRVDRFRSKINKFKANEVASFLYERHLPTLAEIKSIGLPEFSGVSFVSKIRMFLDPVNSATLDFQIMKMQKVRTTPILSQIRIQKTQIPITAHNSNIYEDWCRKMKDIGRQYFGENCRAVDIERGLFHLIQCDEIEEAANILCDA
jgi:hypothetical protein